MRLSHIDNVLARLTICTVAIFATTAVLDVLPLGDRPLTATLTFLLIVLLVSAAWGFRYAVFVSVLAGLGFAWLVPSAHRFWISESRDVFALAAFLVTGIIGSYLSDRARREAFNAKQRHSEAVAAQKQFADLVNSVEGIVWEAAADTLTFSFVSKQAEGILGHPTERWVREPTFWKDHIHPDDREWAVDYCVKAAAEKTGRDFEYRITAADGRIVWLRDILTVVVEGDRATKLRGVMVDITERKRAEEALRERADLLNLTHDSVFVRDMRDMITYWNRGAQELYGWTEEDAVGQVSHQLTQTIFPEPLEEINAELLVTGRWEGELIHTKQDGTQVVVASRWSLERDAAGNAVAVLETNNDITERKRAEEALRESEEQWRAVFENNPTMYFMVDAGGTILSVNPFGAEQLGYTVNELVGSPVLNVFYEADREAVRRNVARCFDQLNWSMNWEARKVRKDGKVLWVRETARAVLLKNQPIILVACEDITERRRAEEALAEAQAELAHLTRMMTMGELTASIAHEVNQPLTAVITSANACLRWLAGQSPNLGEAREAVGRIVRAGNRASEVLKRIRAMLKKTTPQKSPIDINEAIKEVVALAQGEAHRNRASLTADLTAGLPPVFADPVQLQQVVLNLIINGIEAMSSVTDRSRKLLIQTQRDGSGGVMVSVQDSGAGIDPQDIEHLFDAFYTTKAEGMGIGLSISRSIIEAHGGRLWASANIGPGAMFQFSLPANDSNQHE